MTGCEIMGLLMLAASVLLPLAGIFLSILWDDYETKRERKKNND